MNTAQINKHIYVPAMIPEYTGIKYTTTGKMGGDAGHGGQTDLVFLFETSADVKIQDKNSKIIYKYDDCSCEPIKITITVRGDWELAGLNYALKKIGLELLSADAEKMRDNYGE